MFSESPFVSGRRGGYAPRRGRRGSSWPSKKERWHNIPDIENHPIGQLLTTFNNSDLTMPLPGTTRDSSRKVSVSALQISNCRYVASYNWLDSKEATIITPGQFQSLRRDYNLMYKRQTSQMDTSQTSSKARGRQRPIIL